MNMHGPADAASGVSMCSSLPVLHHKTPASMLVLTHQCLFVRDTGKRARRHCNCSSGRRTVTEHAGAGMRSSLPDQQTGLHQQGQKHGL